MNKCWENVVNSTINLIYRWIRSICLLIGIASLGNKLPGTSNK